MPQRKRNTQKRRKKNSLRNAKQFAETTGERCLNSVRDASAMYCHLHRSSHGNHNYSASMFSFPQIRRRQSLQSILPFVGRDPARRAITQPPQAAAPDVELGNIRCDPDDNPNDIAASMARFRRTTNLSEFRQTWADFYLNKVCIPTYLGSFLGSEDNKVADKRTAAKMNKISQNLPILMFDGQQFKAANRDSKQYRCNVDSAQREYLEFACTPEHLNTWGLVFQYRGRPCGLWPRGTLRSK